VNELKSPGNSEHNAISLPKQLTIREFDEPPSSDRNILNNNASFYPEYFDNRVPVGVKLEPDIIEESESEEIKQRKLPPLVTKEQRNKQGDLSTPHNQFFHKDRKSKNSSTVFSKKITKKIQFVGSKQGRLVFHDNGYLWGRSRFHFSNYRIQVHFWTIQLLGIVFILNVLTHHKYNEFYPYIWYSYFAIFIFSNFILILDWIYLLCFGVAVWISVIPLLLNIAYWGFTGYQISIHKYPHWGIGLAFFIVDLGFCIHAFLSLPRIHATYVGIPEISISLMRFLIISKSTRVIDYYWTFMVFPLTGFSIFGTAIFISLILQEIIHILQKRRIDFNIFSANTGNI